MKNFLFQFSVIVDAIVLMTGKADRNLVYRQALKDTGDEEPESLNTIIAIIGITVPVVGGMYFVQKILYGIRNTCPVSIGREIPITFLESPDILSS